MDDLNVSIEAALSAGHLLDSSAANIRELLATSKDPIDENSVAELVSTANWKELNDRFFRKLQFGTGGLRGRSIGKTVTAAERGSAPEGSRPDHPCVGTNTLNFFNLSRATQGLAAYLNGWVASNALPGRPHLVISHDTRHFSREFAEFCAKLAAENGVDVSLFDGPRPTPDMSFAVRHLRALAGIMITASHNPPHDNGYKVNFSDGAGIVSEQVKGIVSQINLVPGADYIPLPPDQQGTVTAIGEDLDRLYLERLRTVMLQPELLQKATGLKIVFTALHGTGGVHIPGILRELGFNVTTVPEQDAPDGAFPTVDSPNPENASALKMALDLAEISEADIVIGTDPDCDRMGVGVRDTQGQLVLLTGNQIGSLMCWYRTKTMFDLGILNDSNRRRATIVKTLVTTDLQSAIAEAFGIGCVNTLTGFKYVGEKLRKYEESLPEDIQIHYRDLDVVAARNAQLASGRFFVFGGEESYGYLGCDFVRDKDGNGAVVMLAELAAFAKSENLTLTEVLDNIYAEFGYYTEENRSKVFEGAEGASQIGKLAASYSHHPPTSVDGSPVTKVRNFDSESFRDEEGDSIPKEKMLFIDLEDGRSFAVRPSGTEPKIKYYLFAKRAPDSFSKDDLPRVKADAKACLESLWRFLELDIAERLR